MAEHVLKESLGDVVCLRCDRLWTKRTLIPPSATDCDGIADPGLDHFIGPDDIASVIKEDYD